MKKLVCLVLIIALIIISCRQETKYPLEGTWKCINIGKLSKDTSLQAMVKTGQIKTFSNKFFTFVGHYEKDTTVYDLFGAGTYILNGNKYEEYIIYHNNKSLIGTKYKALDEIHNDTLIHRHPANDKWELGKTYSTEIYIRLK